MNTNPSKSYAQLGITVILPENLQDSLLNEFNRVKERIMGGGEGVFVSLRVTTHEFGHALVEALYTDPEIKESTTALLVQYWNQPPEKFQLCLVRKAEQDTILSSPLVRSHFEEAGVSRVNTMSIDELMHAFTTNTFSAH